MSIYNLKQWINWKSIPNPKPGMKPMKVPYNLRTDKKIDPLDASNWMTFEQAKAIGAVGFVFTIDHPYVFIDLDDCLLPDGSWKPETIQACQLFAGAAMEVSTSGNGIHIVAKVDKSRLADRKNKWDGWKECYSTDRFMALGHGFQGDFEIDITERVLQFVPERPANDHIELKDGPAEGYTGPEDDAILIDKMLNSKGSLASQFGTVARVQDLWNGVASNLCQVFPSPSGDAYDRSSADAALMSHLAFWTGKDAARMDRLFRRSKLMRDKYESREAYRQSTVTGAVSNCKAFYSFEKTEVEKISDEAIAHGEYLSIEDQAEYFKKCIYVLDSHKVMIPDGTLLRPEQFKSYYGGKEFAMSRDGNKPTRNAFEALTENRSASFPKVKGTVFNPRKPPGEIIDDHVNVYFPPDVKFEEGDIAPFMDLLHKMLPHEQDREIFLAYCAAIVQYPGYKFQWAVVLQGTQGNGKTFFGTCLTYAVGHRYTHSPAAEDLGNAFNSYIENKLLIVVEEVHLQGKRELLDILKPLITNKRTEVQQKGVDKRMIDNYANWLFMTNHKDAVLKTRDDRRYAIMFTGQQNIDDMIRDGLTGGYFPKLWNWANDGGFARVAHFLMNYKIPDELNPAGICDRAPATTSINDAIAASMGRAEQEVVEAVLCEEKGFRGGWISSYALDMLFKDKGVRMSRAKINTMLEQLGYKFVGRSSVAVVQEDLKRPSLYIKRDLWGNSLTVQDYCTAQGYVGN